MRTRANNAQTDRVVWRADGQAMTEYMKRYGLEADWQGWLTKAGERVAYKIDDSKGGQPAFIVVWVDPSKREMVLNPTARKVTAAANTMTLPFQILCEVGLYDDNLAKTYIEQGGYNEWATGYIKGQLDETGLIGASYDYTDDAGVRGYASDFQIVLDAESIEVADNKDVTMNGTITFEYATNSEFGLEEARYEAQSTLTHHLADNLPNADIDLAKIPNVTAMRFDEDRFSDDWVRGQFEDIIMYSGNNSETGIAELAARIADKTGKEPDLVAARRLWKKMSATGAKSAEGWLAQAKSMLAQTRGAKKAASLKPGQRYRKMSPSERMSFLASPDWTGQAEDGTLLAGGYEIEKDAEGNEETVYGWYRPSDESEIVRANEQAEKAKSAGKKLYYVNAMRSTAEFKMTGVGEEEYSPEQVKAAIARLEWEDTPAKGNIDLPFMQGEALNKVIQEYKLPRPAKLALYGTIAEGHGFYGAEFHYKNADLILYIADTGTETFVVAKDVTMKPTTAARHPSEYVSVSYPPKVDRDRRGDNYYDQILQTLHNRGHWFAIPSYEGGPIKRGKTATQRPTGEPFYVEFEWMTAGDEDEMVRVTEYRNDRPVRSFEAMGLTKEMAAEELKDQIKERNRYGKQYKKEMDDWNKQFGADAARKLEVGDTVRFTYPGHTFEGKTGEIVDTDRKRGPNGVQTVYEVKGEGIDSTDADSWATADELTKVTAQKATAAAGDYEFYYIHTNKEHDPESPSWGERVVDYGYTIWSHSDEFGNYPGPKVDGFKTAEAAERAAKKKAPKAISYEEEMKRDKARRDAIPDDEPERMPYGTTDLDEVFGDSDPAKVMASMKESVVSGYELRPGDQIAERDGALWEVISVSQMGDKVRVTVKGDFLSKRGEQNLMLKGDGRFKVVRDEKVEAMVATATIRKEADGYHVRSKDGKNLGGPYKTENEAKDRLKQVEYFKHKKAAAVGDIIHIAKTGDTDIYLKKKLDGGYAAYAKPKGENMSQIDIPVQPTKDLAIDELLGRYGDIVFDEGIAVEPRKNWDSDTGKEPIPFEGRHKYRVGDKVRETNDNGVDLGIKTITKLDKRWGRPGSPESIRYYVTPTDTPWFSVPERNLDLVTEKTTAKSKGPMTDETYAVYGDSEFYRTGDNFYFSDEGRLIPLTEAQADEIRGALGESTALLKTEEDKILSVRNLVKDLGLLKEKRQEMKRMATKAELQTTHGDRVEALTRNTLSLVNAVKAVYSGPVAAAMHPIADRVGQKARQVYNETHTNSWVTGTLQPLSRDPKAVRARITDLEREVRELKLPLGLANVMANRLKDELKSLKNAMDNL